MLAMLADECAQRDAKLLGTLADPCLHLWQVQVLHAWHTSTHVLSHIYIYAFMDTLMPNDVISDRWRHRPSEANPIPFSLLFASAGGNVIRCPKNRRKPFVGVIFLGARRSASKPAVQHLEKHGASCKLFSTTHCAAKALSKFIHMTRSISGPCCEGSAHSRWTGAPRSTILPWAPKPPT